MIKNTGADEKIFRYQKIINIMRNTFILLIFITTNMFATSGYSQTTRFDFTLNNTTLEEVFSAIEKNSEFSIIFKSNDVNLKEKVSIQANKQTVDEILDKVLKNQRLSYEIKEKHIIIFKQESSVNNPANTIAQQSGKTITGSIVDNTGETLPGVNISIKGTTTGVTSDIDGKYTIIVPDNQSVLQFTYIGYVPQELIVGSRAIIDIILLESVSMLEEVVVVGYGTLNKRDFTGAVSSVKTPQLEKESPTNVQDLLIGNIPGLNVSHNTSPKGGGDLMIRGKATLTAGSSPLLVVDGVIYYGDLVDINPHDIESIDVLKDASSAAVYGAKAASGVVLITTKKGNSSKPTISFKSDLGIATMAVRQKPFTPEEFLVWRQNVMENIYVNHQPHQFSDPRTLPSGISVEQWMAYTNSSGDPVTTWLQRLNFQNEQIKNYQAGNTIDWYDKVFQNSLRQNYTVSLSGKKEDFSYYMSLEYLDNEGIVVGDDFSTFRGRINLEGKVAKFLTVGINMQLSDRDESSVPASWDRAVSNTPYGSMYNADGTIRYSPDSDDGRLITFKAKNPFLEREYIDKSDKTKTLFSTIYLRGELPFGFSYQVNFTPNYTYRKVFEANSSLNYDFTQIGGSASRRNYETYNWQLDNIIKWDKTFNNMHRFDVTLLANSEKFQSWDNKMGNQGFQPNDNLGYHNIGSGTNAIISSNDEYSTGDALMARLNYTLKQRYMLTLSVRRDGYSAFGQKNPRATFPAAALGWVFSEEKFLENVGWLEYAKLRLSYGINGNRDIKRYQAISDLSTGKYLYTNPSGTVYQVSQLFVNRMSNPNLSWEKTTSFNVGLDFNILNKRLGGSIDFYNKSTTDLLVQRSLPDITGFKEVMDNLGEVQNKGIEISLNSSNIETPDFKWKSTINFTFNKNKIIHLYGPVNVLDDNGNIIGQTEPDDASNGWFIGHDIDAVWDLKVLGVWQEEEAAEAAKYGVRPGDFKLEDVNGDNLYTDVDRQFLGTKTPKFRWTLRNDFTIFKNFEFSFMLYSNVGHMKSFNWAKNGSDQVFPDKSSSYKMPYWTPENRINDYAATNSSDGGAIFNVYRKVSFIRLHNIALSYTVPKSIVQKASLENLRLHFNISNAAMYAPDWNYWDPEYWYSDPKISGPTPRYYTFGINLTL